MKFTLLFKHTKESKEILEQFIRDGYVYGIKMVRLDEGRIIDDITGACVNRVYAARCKSSILGFLRHKLTTEMTHIIGWKT